MATYAILGGYGHLGRPLARALLERLDARVRIVGRREAEARAFAAQLALEAGGERVEARCADASRAGELAEAVRGADWMILAFDGATPIASALDAALAARVHCLDLLITPGREATWAAYAERFRAAGLLGITEAGVQPGLPGVLLSAALAALPRAREVDVAALIRLRIPPDTPMPASAVDLVRSLVVVPRVYRRGRPAVDAPSLLVPYRIVRFGPPFGAHAVAVAPLPEIAAVAARHPEVARIRYLVGGFNALATWVALPLLVPVLALFGRWLARPIAWLLFYGVLRPFSGPPHGIALRVEARAPDGRRWALELHHSDEYGLTVDAVVGALEQLARRAPPPGLSLMADALDPEPFFARLAGWGARIEVTEAAAPERWTASK